jgi:hypothetical protein
LAPGGLHPSRALLGSARGIPEDRAEEIFLLGEAVGRMRRPVAEAVVPADHSITA